MPGVLQLISGSIPGSPGPETPGRPPKIQKFGPHPAHPSPEKMFQSRAKDGIKEAIAERSPEVLWAKAARHCLGKGLEEGVHSFRPARAAFKRLCKDKVHSTAPIRLIMLKWT